MSTPARLSFDQILCRLHLHAVLPALEELVRISAEARAVVAGWDFSWRLSVLGGPATTLRCRDGVLNAFPGRTQPAAVNLLFLSDRQLNRSFVNERGLPPLPLGAPWHWTKLRPFVALTRLLNDHLQPSEDALRANADLRAAHTRLLLGVLSRAAPLVGRYDRAAAGTLADAPRGRVELRVPALDFTACLGGDNGNGQTPSSAADATIIFRDEAALDDALHGRLDATAAIGLGRLEVHGLIPLADAWSYVLDRVENYLQPQSGAAA